MIAPTSMMAYDMILNDLGDRQTQVFNAFKKLEFSTSAMVAKEINLPINCVTGRCLELRKKFLLERSHISTCPVTRNTAQFWRLKRSVFIDEQENISDETWDRLKLNQENIK